MGFLCFICTVFSVTKLRRIGIEVPPFLKKEDKALEGKLDEIAQNFGRFYRHALPLWEKDEGPRPMIIQDTPSILSKKRGVPEHRAVYYLLMDGMRWDLWESIKRASHPPICQCDQLSRD